VSNLDKKKTLERAWKIESIENRVRTYICTMVCMYVVLFLHSIVYSNRMNGISAKKDTVLEYYLCNFLDLDAIMTFVFIPDDFLANCNYGLPQ
jgi:hypothetical protein